MNETLVFITIQIAMVFYACAEAYMEQDTGWRQNDRWFRINFGRYNYTAYHIFAYWLALPLIIIGLPTLLLGYGSKLVLFLFASYLIGTIVEDFTWFLVNPHYSWRKWHPDYTQWYPWIRIRRFYLPMSYAVKGIVASYIFIVVLG
jgi:hypothetical protein